MKRAREEDGDAGDAVPEETGSPVARPSPSADAPGAIADRREKNTPTADHDPPDPALAVYEGARASVTLKPEFAKGLRAADGKPYDKPSKAWNLLVVLGVETESEIARDTAEMRPRCSRDAAEIRPRYGRDTAEI